jgi:two-component system sensor histidine kinase KdpD
MLAVARVEAGRSPQPEMIVVDKVLAYCAESLRREMPDLALKVSIESRGMVITGIEDHIDQILHNLVQNAHKYSPQGSQVEITAAPAGEMVQISVADRGFGLNGNVAIFQPFERADYAARHAPGLGLGLAVCRTLVEAQGGRIWAEPRQGNGTIFSFTLPRYQEAESGLP